MKLKFFQARDSLVNRSIPAGELRHMQRVGGFINALFHIFFKFRCSQQQASLFSLFGHFAFNHDRKKAWISADILGKTVPLTFKGLETITMHPLYAHRYFKKNPSVLNAELTIKRSIFDAAIFHHERWDGCGYSYGIFSNIIPLISSVTSVCDAYNSITHKRPYRWARTHEDDCEEIAKHAGEHNLILISL